MSHDLTKLPHKLNTDKATCRVIVETTKGRRSKLDYDKKIGVFRLKSLLPEGMSFPLDFGFVPSTSCDDGDPLDAMVIADEATPTGTLLDVRIIGVIEAEEVEDGRTERNDRLITVTCISHLYAKLERIADLDKRFTDNLIQFWTNKNLIDGKKFKCIGVRGPRQAIALIEKSTCAQK